MRNAPDGWIAAVLAALLVYGLAQGAPAAPTADGAAEATNKATPPVQPATPKTPDEQVMEEQIKAYGVQAGAPVNAGFVFFDGRYLDAPYTVTRKGLMVLINDVVVWRHPWPLKEPLPGDIDPPIPAEIKRETSLYDQAFKDYWINKAAFLRKHFTRDEECRLMEEAFRKLPCVKEARIDDKNPSILHVTSYVGETHATSLVSLRGRTMKVDKESVVARTEEMRRNYEVRLSMNDGYLLFSSGGYTTFGKGHCKTLLPKIVEILRSNLTEEAKFEAVQKAGMPQIKPTSFGKMVTHFSASPQLEARLEQLKNEPEDADEPPPK